MADYINNCKRQEQAVDNARHILMRGCTSQHCWRLASCRLGTWSPNQVHSPCWWQKIMMTMTSDRSWQRTMLRQCSAKLTEKNHCLLIWVTLRHTTQFCLNQVQGVAPMTYRISGCSLFGHCHASNNASASACNVSLFSLSVFSVLLKITLCR